MGAKSEVSLLSVGNGTFPPHSVAKILGHLFVFWLYIICIST